MYPQTNYGCWVFLGGIGPVDGDDAPTDQHAMIEYQRAGWGVVGLMTCG